MRDWLRVIVIALIVLGAAAACQSVAAQTAADHVPATQAGLAGGHDCAPHHHFLTGLEKSLRPLAGSSALAPDAAPVPSSSSSSSSSPLPVPLLPRARGTTVLLT